MYISSHTCLMFKTLLKKMQAALLESGRAPRHTLVPQLVLKELTLGTEVVMIIIRVRISVSSFDLPCACAYITHISWKLDQGVKHLLDLIHAMAFTHAGS